MVELLYPQHPIPPDPTLRWLTTALGLRHTQLNLTAPEAKNWVQPRLEVEDLLPFFPRWAARPLAGVANPKPVSLSKPLLGCETVKRWSVPKHDGGLGLFGFELLTFSSW